MTIENTFYLHFPQYINKNSPFSVPDLFLAFLLIYDILLTPTTQWRLLELHTTRNIFYFNYNLRVIK